MSLNNKKPNRLNSHDILLNTQFTYKFLENKPNKTIFFSVETSL